MKWILLFFLVLTMPLASGAPYLQDMGDASRTGALADPGPEFFDLAFTVEGHGGTVAPPIIMGDVIYQLDTVEDAGLHAFNTTTGEAMRLTTEVSTVPDGLVSDGRRLFYWAQGDLVAYDPATDEVERRTFELDQADAFPHHCAPGASFQGALYFACDMTSFVLSPGGGSIALQRGFVVLAIDAVTLEPVWAPMIADQSGAVVRAEGYELAVNERAILVAVQDQARGVSITGEGLIRITHEGDWTTYRGGFEEYTAELTELQGADAAGMTEGILGEKPRLLLDDERAYMAGTLLHVFSIDDLALQRASWLAPEGAPRGLETGAPALANGQLLLPSPRDMRSMREDPLAPSWSTPTTGEWAPSGPTLVAGARVFASQTNGLIAVWDQGTGELLWERLVGNALTSDTHMAIGEGLLAVARSGNLYVFGQPAGAPRIQVDADPRPPVNAPTPFKITTQSTGVLGDTLQFRIRWGDGTTTVTDGESPVYHTFTENGPTTVVVTGTNDAGQERSVVLMADVGARDPTVLETAFSAENQESTFFFLGLVLTLLFAGFGVVRLRRKRYRLRRELAAADAFVREHGDAPDAMREALREHRLRARRLFLDGRLDEGSTGILERHIDELLRDHRLSRVEAELGFLPHELFRSMQEMLRDARVTELERNQFLRSLDAERALTGAQKGKVKRHVEKWHREDVV